MSGDNDRNLGNNHMLGLQILLRTELCKPFVENAKQSWELSLNVLAEHLQSEFSSRTGDANVQEFLLMFLLELTSNEQVNSRRTQAANTYIIEIGVCINDKCIYSVS